MTVWTFENRIGEAGAKALFDGMNGQMLAKGFIARGGQIIDATLVSAPKQHLTKGEKEVIGEDATPADIADAFAVVPAKVGYRFEVRTQAAGQPHQFDIAPRFSLQSSTRLDTVQITVDVELEKNSIGDKPRFPGKPSQQQRWLPCICYQFQPLPPPQRKTSVLPTEPFEKCHSGPRYFDQEQQQPPNE